MQRIDALLYEYDQEALPFGQEDDAERRKIFTLLEKRLDAIWKKNDYYGNAQEKESTQQFLQLNYRDYSVQAKQFVGIIQSNGIRLVLLPKIFRSSVVESEEERIEEASSDLLYMLSYAENLKPPRTDGGALREKKHQDFFELFVYLFASQTWKTLDREVYRAYQTVEENLPMVKGAIMFTEHFKRNVCAAKLHQTACRYDVFQEDNAFNRVLKYVTRCLLSASRNADNKRLLRNILAMLVDVTDEQCCYDDSERIIFNSTQREWIPILHYCRLFLRHSLVSLRSKNIEVLCFLIDMNVLFESFITSFLKRHMKDWKVESQKSNLSVASTEDGQDVFQMQHDIFMTKGERSIIIDTKYKETNFSEKNGGISQADVYQLATYAVRRGVKDLILLYPRYIGDQGPEFRHFFIHETFSGQKIRLRCCKLQLTELPDSTREKDQLLYGRLRQVLELDQQIPL